MMQAKILLAEDDPQLLGLLAEFLQEEGYQVNTASDGHRARAALEEEEFHLALFDLMLPGLSGLELLSLVKSRTPETEVVIFTGYADLESSLTALRLGAYDYLVKSGLRLEEVGAVVARALEKSRLAQDNRKLLAQLRQTQAELARQRAQELAQIRRIGESLAGPLTREGLVQGVLNLIWESLPLDILGLELEGAAVKRPRQNYRVRPGLDESGFKSFKAWLQAGAVSPGAGEMPGRPESCPFPALIWSRLGEGEISGLVAAGRQDPFNPEEEALFRIFALQADAALKNLGLFEQVKSLALRDSLTGLYNYRHLWEVLAYEVEKSRRYRQPLSVLYLDIDDFKLINDRYGHPQGDLVLKEVAARLIKAVRLADLVCRIGGEEFVILLSQTAVEQALVLAERLRAAISTPPIPLPDGDLQISISIGYAGLQPEMSGEDLVRQADAALYRAKQGGKDRVCA